MTFQDPLRLFHAPTRAWFAGTLGSPTDAQVGAWEAIAQGSDTLVIAPTGSGKTLAAFLVALDRLMFTPPSPSPGTRVLYISPLKALGTDVRRNLSAPLVGMRNAAASIDGEEARSGDATVTAHPVSVGVRSGDTSPADRRRLISNPPDILITTPESLFLMLSSSARDTLAHVDTVIIDEIHAVAGSKRGVHLALSLARLDELITRSGEREAPQRIGLSATVEPADEVAQFLSRSDGRAPASIVRPPSSKQWDLSIRVPVPDFSAIDPPEDASEEEATGGTIWPHVERQVLAEIESHRSTIVFVNSRRQAEKLTSALNRLWVRRQQGTTPAVHTAASEGEADRVGHPAAPETADSSSIAMAHHGSMSKERRAEIEEALKAGDLRCVVATNSLELGIDMGAVDCVVQVEAAPSVASLLQRVGRAGHSVGDTSRGVLQPLHASDVLRSTVAVREAMAGNIEPLRIPRNALDVLAQHTVSAALEQDLPVEEWWELVRSSFPYATLPRSSFDATVDLLTGRYPSTSFSDLRPRLVLDRETCTLSARPGAQRVVVTSGGTIPDRGLFPVYLLAGDDDSQARRVGELDEEMVYESRRGDVITLGTSSWRIEDITHDRVSVSPAFGLTGKVPFWHGDSLGRPPEMGRAIATFMDELAGKSAEDIQQHLTGANLDRNGAQILARMLSEQLEATGAVPGARRMVVERFRDEMGDWRVILHCPLGARITGPWALAIQARVQEQFGLDGQVFAADDGIVLRLPYGDEPPTADLFFFAPEDADRIIRAGIGTSALFAARFREAAARALLLPRRDPRSRSPLWQQRKKAAQLLDVARAFPDFPIMLEAAREALQDVYDLPALLEVLSGIESGSITVVESETSEPSPLARSLLFGYLAQFIYDTDAPLAERRSAALALDPAMLAELLGTTSLRELLDPDVLNQIDASLRGLDDRSVLQTAEDLADALRRRGPHTLEQISRRVGGNDQAAREHEAVSLAERLESARRAIRVRICGREHIAAIEDAALLRDGLGVALPPGIPESLLGPSENAAEQLIARWAKNRGPFQAQELLDAFGLAPAVTSLLLERLATQDHLVKGEFTPGKQGEEWVSPDVLTRVRRASLAASRADIAPSSPAAYGVLLGRWHQISERSLRGPDGVLTVLDQLSGLSLPASVWENQVLPARVRDYTPGLLDQLLSSGEVTWSAHGRIGTQDAKIRLHLTETLALSLPNSWREAAEATIDHESLAWEVLTVLRSTPGALRSSEIHSSLAASGHPVAGPDLSAALEQLALAALITNDSFAFPRSLLSSSTSPSSASRSSTRLATRRGLSRRGAARLSAAMLREGPHASGLQTGFSGRAATGVAAGRWSALSVPDVDEAARHIAMATLLADRHAVITRGAFSVEDIPGSFASVYRTLSAMEDSGAIRRGYFLEGLGASQFASSDAVDALRDVERELSAPRRRPLLSTLSAVDPANPYGASLPWPETPDGITEALRPARRAGALVILVDGRLAAYIERGGKSMLWWQDASLVSSVARQIVAAVARHSYLPQLRIEKINGHSIASDTVTDLVEALTQWGAYRSPRAVRVHAGDPMQEGPDMATPAQPTGHAGR